jgi:hypothetical protein
MPFADAERRRSYNRAWRRKKMLRGSPHRITSGPTLARLAEAQATPGVEHVVGTYGSRGSAGVLAWRIRAGFYGDHFDARISGTTVYAVYVIRRRR